MTAVEWLYNELMMINFQYATNRITPGYFQEQLEKIKEQAKEMEKKQIKNERLEAYNNGYANGQKDAYTE